MAPQFSIKNLYCLEHGRYRTSAMPLLEFHSIPQFLYFYVLARSRAFYALARSIAFYPLGEEERRRML